MRTSPSICARKRRYATEAEALNVAAKAAVSLRPYCCELCRQYHLTSRTKGMRLPDFERKRRALSFPRRGEVSEACSARS
nr:hypothetical protein [Novosphingobium sp. 9U]